MEWLDEETIGMILGIITGFIIIIMKMLNIPLSTLNIFKSKNQIDTKSEILDDIEKSLTHNCNKYLSKIGRVLTFCEICKPSSSDFFDEYLKLWVSITRKTNVSYRKLTLDLTKVRIFNSIFVAHIAGIILNVKKYNEIKLLILVKKDSKLFDMIGNFEMIKEDSTSIKIKVLKDYYV